MADPSEAAINQQISILLREERERRELSKNKLSELSGLSRPAIDFAENPGENPTILTLLRISRALQIDLGMLINEAERKAREVMT